MPSDVISIRTVDICSKSGQTFELWMYITRWLTVGLSVSNDVDVIDTVYLSTFKPRHGQPIHIRALAAQGNIL